MIPVVDWLVPPRRPVAPPQPPGMLAESARQAEAAERAARALGPGARITGTWGELPATRDWPDPYGPDPVVFGSVPRVRA